MEHLAKDPTIVIKPSDKCGSIVVMNTADYEQACLAQLTNPTHYVELPKDPTNNYIQQVAEAV